MCVRSSACLAASLPGTLPFACTPTTSRPVRGWSHPDLPTPSAGRYSSRHTRSPASVSLRERSAGRRTRLLVANVQVKPIRATGDTFLMFTSLDLVIQKCLALTSDESSGRKILARGSGGRRLLTCNIMLRVGGDSQSVIRTARTQFSLSYHELNCLEVEVLDILNFSKGPLSFIIHASFSPFLPIFPIISQILLLHYHLSIFTSRT